MCGPYCKCQECKNLISRSINNTIKQSMINQKIMEDYDNKNKGNKYDDGKPQLSIIPIKALEYEAQALMYGANKYGRDNYKKGIEYTRVIDAALRHIYAFANKENNDSESSLSHLGHARANLAMLIYYIENQVGKDDR